MKVWVTTPSNEVTTARQQFHEHQTREEGDETTHFQNDVSTDRVLHGSDCTFTKYVRHALIKIKILFRFIVDK